MYKVLKLNNKTNYLVKKWAKDLNRHLTREDIYMSNRHIKRCSTSRHHREIQIKTKKYYYTAIRMAKIQKLTTSNAGMDVEKQELSFIADGNAK